MISSSTQILVKGIISRIERQENVELSERIYLHKLASTSRLVRNWLKTALGSEAEDIDSELS